MDKLLDTWVLVGQIRAAIALSQEPGYSDNFHSIFAEYATSLIKSYRVDDYIAVRID